MLETPVLEIAIALVGIQLAVLLYLHYRREADESTAATADQGSEPADPSYEATAVECGDCGAENEPSYRYCRRCVSDLSGDAVSGHRGRSPSERLF